MIARFVGTAKIVLAHNWSWIERVSPGSKGFWGRYSVYRVQGSGNWIDHDGGRVGEFFVFTYDVV